MKQIEIQSPALTQTNTFLLITEAGSAVAIDPAAPAARYREELDHNKARLKVIFLTHGHYDHVGSAVELAQATGAAIYLDPRDLRGDRLFPLSASDAPFLPYPPSNTLSLDELTFRFYPTPGHTPGSYCLYVDGALFVGDTLFAGSCGRTDLEGGDSGAMFASLKRIKNLPLVDDTKVFPGHGPSTTLGEERRQNPYLRSL